MNKTEEKILKDYLRVVISSAFDQFLSERAAPEVEDKTIQRDKNSTSRQGSAIVEDAVKKIMKTFKKIDIKDVESIAKNSTLVTEMLDSVQSDFEKDAKKLSEE